MAITNRFPVMFHCGAGLLVILMAMAAFGEWYPEGWPPDNFDDLNTYYPIIPGVFVIEAENCRHTSRWLEEDDLEGFTGDGYLRYVGPCGSCACQNQPEGEDHADLTGGCQSPVDHLLFIKVYVSNPGAYKIDVRSRKNNTEDSANDFWFHLIGEDLPIRRRNVYGPPSAWCFKYDHNKETQPYSKDYWLVHGVNTFYIGGRSRDWKVDRIIICKGENLVPAATNLSLPESPTTPPVSSVHSQSQTVSRMSIVSHNRCISIGNSDCIAYQLCTPNGRVISHGAVPRQGAIQIPPDAHQGVLILRLQDTSGNTTVRTIAGVR